MGGQSPPVALSHHKARSKKVNGRKEGGAVETQEDKSIKEGEMA